jgi:hypothetical protein
MRMLKDGMTMSAMKTALPTIAMVVIGLCAVVVPARAAEDSYRVELRVIEATPGDGKNAVIDKKLTALAKDLKPLPFSSYRVIDQHTTAVRGGERVSLEIPGGTAAKRRFLMVSAKGLTAGNKLRFQLGIEAMRFDTLVSVPDGGTIIVGGPRDAAGHSLLFAFTARSQP